MEYRQLGVDGPLLPVLGLGTWPLGGGMGHVDRETAISTIHAAIDSGITLIDTAQAYLTSEATIGKALKGGYRDRCFLATKVSGNYSPEGIRSAMENSLRVLEVDYVDLYQIHSWAPWYPIQESMETMVRLREEGKTRYIGVSNFNAEQMNQALKTARFQSNQPRYNMFDRQIEAEDIPFCEHEGIGILAHSPLAKGLLTGKYTPDHRFPADDERSGFTRFQNETFAGLLAVAEQLTEVAHAKGLLPGCCGCRPSPASWSGPKAPLSSRITWVP
jgi:aryl-alcohol dehydrogenase-like predicted oxidoreductase